MLSIQQQQQRPSRKCTPHLLPCRVHHDGPVDASSRYWNPRFPTDQGEGHGLAYFRGRRLEGREIGVPGGWRGVVVKGEGKKGGDAESGGEEGVLEEVAAFEGFVVWGHDGGVVEDGFVRGVEEWVGFAEAVGGIFFFWSG